MKYRYEIDGLRAIAVLIVILDHLGIGWCSGGFVGVDVFFAISGYVITRNIYKDIINGNFSMSAFYERRIRRLLPGLAAITAISLIAGWFIMLPNDFQSFTATIPAVGLALSNVLFWKQDGYFSALSDTKPMLHTWSLAVEEQFYLIYPLILTWIYASKRKVFLPVLWILFFLSLSLGSIGAFIHPRSAFFLMPPRLWEMLIGGIVFLVFNSLRPNRLLGFGLSYGGIGLIASAALFYSSSTPFPGLAALVPVIGGILFILSGQAEHKTLLFRFMVWSPMVYIGKISYLLYLTHWPIIVFWTYYKITTLGNIDIILILALSFIVSALLYAFIEGPFRSRSVLKERWKAYSMAVSFAALCCAIGVTVYKGKGYPGRFERQLAASRYKVKEISQDDGIMRTVIPIAEGQRLDHGHVDPENVGTFGWGSGPADLAVFGDSHAGHLFDGFVSEAYRFRHRIKFYVNYCSPPALGLSSWNEGGVKYNNDVISILCADRNIKMVFLAANWTIYLKGGVYIANNRNLLQFNGRDIPAAKAPEILLTQIAITAAKLREFGKQVYVLEPLPDYKRNVATTIDRCIITHSNVYDYINTSRDAYLDRQSETIILLKRAAEKSDSIMIPSAEAFWNGNNFEVEDGGVSLYADYNHLSPLGSRRLANFVFEKIFAGSLKATDQF